MFNILSIWFRFTLSLLPNPDGGWPWRGQGGTGGKGTGGAGKGINLGNNPGLLTSTGGLSGKNTLLVTPVFNVTILKSAVIGYNPSNFNCEDPCEYDFRQEANYGQIPGEGRTCTIHLIILKYRELGQASFSVNVTVFDQTLDSFITTAIPVNIPAIKLTKTRLKNFPDGRIHTLRLNPKGGPVQGERPQVSITINPNSGPVSITKLVLCGNADETAQQ